MYVFNYEYSSSGWLARNTRSYNIINVPLQGYIGPRLNNQCSSICNC